MTSTSIKDVGSMLNSLSTSAAYQTTGNNGVSFQSVWSNQTKESGQEEISNQIRPKESNSTENVGEAMKAKKQWKTVEREDVRSGEATESAAGIQDEEELEEAMEVLGTAAVSLMQKISNTLGISMEEMQDMLGQMGMTATDLLDAENLSGFLLQITGAEDAMMLLTNEALYGDYKQLMQELSNMLSQDSGMNGMTLAQLQEAVEQSVNAEETISEPIIEVSVEDDALGQAVNGTDGQTATAVAEDGKVAEKQAGEQKGENQGTGAEGGSLFQQNLKAEVLMQQEAVYSTGSTFGTDTENIMRQIMDFMKVQIKPDVSNLEMQLHPESLGTLQINVSSRGGVLTANFVTENEAVKAALESQMVQLKDNFAQQGIKVEAIEVTVQTHQFEQNLEQGQNRGQSESENRTSRTRRIRLDGSLDMEEVSEMDEDDQLAAEMMAANGNTVDYSV